MSCKQCGHCCLTMDIALTPAEVDLCQAGKLPWPIQISPIGWYIMGQDSIDGGCPYFDRETRLCKIYNSVRPQACIEFFCEKGAQS